MKNIWQRKPQVISGVLTIHMEQSMQVFWGLPMISFTDIQNLPRGLLSSQKKNNNNKIYMDCGLRPDPK